MTTKKIDQLPAASAVTADDLVPIVDAPGTSPVTQKATAAQLNTFIRGAGGPLTATDISSNTSSLAFNDAQASVNTVIKGTTDANLVVVDASNNRVGIGTSTPTVLLEINGTINATTFSGDGSALTSLPTVTTGKLQTVSADPSSPTDGTVWYNSTSATMKARKNGATVTFTLS
jgi:hypothetical protein